MAHDIDYTLHGDDMQIVEIELDPGEAVRAEAGAMLYMDGPIQMDTGTGGGFMKGLKRRIAGESFFIPSFTNGGRDMARVAFSAPYPGKVIPIELSDFGGTFLCQKDTFLCAAQGIEIEVAFTKKIGAGLFGGEGFILQKLTGDGLAFAHAGGTVIERDLARGETLRVDTGCLVAFETSVDYDIEFQGGFKNALFGGEGLFLAKIQGPGKVYLQSLPFSRLADRIVAASRSFSNRGETGGNGGALGALGGLAAGGLLGGLLGEDQ
ncbi:TIGR00266 family protein [Rubricoccus marinus]|uniref:TIGR00266 family protein n=1 Tax=Rubricoccus marinus TaxID=716817 RepID=A0A259TYX8_9BACT|nr:TIGR00266 family protein [Rubricoccus marinus]OZC02817.1 TIGR00266 family protein [Rubricoccus marinus]